MLKKHVSNSVLKDWLANPKKPKPGYKGDLRITLPTPLIKDYAEASAGHSGFGAGARPVGISLSKTFIKENFGTPKNAIKHYYSSVSGLRELLALSRCDFDHKKLNSMKKAKPRASIKIPTKLPNIDVKVTRPKTNEILIKISF